MIIEILERNPDGLRAGEIRKRMDVHGGPVGASARALQQLKADGVARYAINGIWSIPSSDAPPDSELEPEPDAAAPDQDDATADDDTGIEEHTAELDAGDDGPDPEPDPEPALEREPDPEHPPRPEPAPYLDIPTMTNGSNRVRATEDASVVDSRLRLVDCSEAPALRLHTDLELSADELDSLSNNEVTEAMAAVRCLVALRMRIHHMRKAARES